MYKPHFWLIVILNSVLILYSTDTVLIEQSQRSIKLCLKTVSSLRYEFQSHIFVESLNWGLVFIRRHMFDDPRSTLDRECAFKIRILIFSIISFFCSLSKCTLGTVCISFFSGHNERVFHFYQICMNKNIRHVISLHRFPTIHKWSENRFGCYCWIKVFVVLCTEINVYIFIIHI